MGQRQDKLKSIIDGLLGTKPQPKPTKTNLLNSKFSDNIFAVYKSLNGQLSEPPTGFGAWDVSTKDFIFELDEERHFNQYRGLTLCSTFYKKHSFFSLKNYLVYCRDREVACLKTASWGNNWKNNSTEKHFIKSGKEGDLSQNGSSRWRQRAYYDFLKDVSSRVMNIPIIRISIYDTFEGHLVNQLLMTEQDRLLINLIKFEMKKHPAK